MKVFRRKSDGLYCGKYKDQSGKWKYVYRKDKQAAQDALGQALQDGHTPAAPQHISPTVSAYLDEWLADIRSVVSERTYAARTSIIENHLRPGLGHITLDRLSPTDIKALYRSRAHLAPKTIAIMHVLLKQILSDAVRDRLLSTNPAADVRLPKRANGDDDKDILSIDQVRTLLDACRGERFEHVFTVMATCGLRLGEALVLTGNSVDVEGGVLKVTHTLYRGRLCPCKTAAEEDPQTPSESRREP